MANGILIVDKPEGWTSQDVVAKLRGVFHEKRVGHGGTLDPMATGVLPVFLGRATRAVEFLTGAQKAYCATLRLGEVTDTQDATGRLLARRAVNVTQAELEAILTRFTGEQLQLPPMYSAIKIRGQKLYEIARRGGEVERIPRTITVYTAQLRQFQQNEATIFFRCSKGTYVRTLCHDIGEALGCGGCMCALRREEAGMFTLAQAHSMQEILAAEDPLALLLPTQTLFARDPALTLSAAQEKKCRNGAPFCADCADGRYRLFSPSGEFLALAEARFGTMQCIKSFFAPPEE